MASVATQAESIEARLGVYIERVDASRRMSRFYSIRVQPTLFGDWAVVCQWVRIGSRGQMRERWLATWPEARAAQNQQLVRKIRRGVCVVESL